MDPLVFLIEVIRQGWLEALIDQELVRKNGKRKYRKLQKFRENPIEDHVMVNNFVGFSYLKDHEKIHFSEKHYAC